VTIMIKTGSPTVAANPTPITGIANLNLASQHWREQALCAQVGSEVFFLPKGGSAKEAREICAKCPVAAECLQYAVNNPEINDGIWAGKTSEQLQKMRVTTNGGERRKLRAYNCQVCGRTFEAKNSQALYCSSTHRKLAAKLKQRKAAA